MNYVERILNGEVLSIEEEMDMLGIPQEEREAFKKAQSKDNPAAVAARKRFEEMKARGEI